MAVSREEPAARVRRVTGRRSRLGAPARFAHRLSERLPGRALDSAPGRGLPCRAGDDGVGTPGGGERGPPALVAEARELEIETLARHAGRDDAHAGPPVEPPPAIAKAGARRRRSRRDG